MEKRKSTQTTDMAQTAVWLPHGMREKLTAGGLKLSDEIRRRLQNSLDDEKVNRDPITGELLDAIKHVEGNLDEPWHKNSFFYDVFKAAINKLLSNYQPEARFETTTKLATKYQGARPQTIGEIFADVAFKASAKRPSKRPFADEERRLADKERRLAAKEKRLAAEEKRLADKEKRLAAEEKRR
jgi:hypothetical protein